MASSAFAMPSICPHIPRLRTVTHIRRRLRDGQARHVRSFNTSKPASAVHGQAQVPKNIMSQMPPQQAMTSRMKNIPRQEVPTDLGLMPLTLIRPPLKTLPRLLSADWKRRMKFEWLWTKHRFQNFFTLVYFLRSQRPKSVETKKKMKLPYNLVERTVVARDLHASYYIALADGDMSTIKKIACKGLIQSSECLLALRKPGDVTSFAMSYTGMKYPQFLRWPLLSFLPFSATKIVSDKVVPLPFGENNVLRQCIVRIQTRQELDKFDGKGVKTAEMTEYVVVQRMRIEEQDDGWKIWGTTKPSTWEEIEKMMGEGTAIPELTDRLQGQISKLTGM